MLLLSRTYTDTRPFILFFTTTLSMRLWVHGRLGGDLARTGDPNRPKGYARHLSSQVSYTQWVLSRWLNFFMPTGSSELILCFSLLVCKTFPFPIKMSLSQCTCSLLSFQSSLWFYWWGSEWMALWCLAVSWDETMTSAYS